MWKYQRINYVYYFINLPDKLLLMKINVNRLKVIRKIILFFKVFVIIYLFNFQFFFVKFNIFSVGLSFRIIKKKKKIMGTFQ